MWMGIRTVSCVNMRWAGVTAAVLAAVALSACATIMPRVALPLMVSQVPVVEGYDDIRARGDVVTPRVAAIIDRQYAQILAAPAGTGARARTHSADFLAISGGGSDGAFAAGYLNGWTAAGTRPAFEIVTGVSTGALAAPFAFLGKDYDRALRRIFTQVTDKDLYTSNGPLGVIGESLLDPTPMRAFIAAELTDEMLDRLAAEHELGRRLLIQTTDIERQIPYIWNITRIATHKTADRRRLITDILMASAAVPGVFPPVRINVTVDGQHIEELHVDGGLAAQVFFAPPGLDLATFEKRHFGKHRDHRMILIRNGKMNPETNATNPQTLPLAARAISTLIKYQSMADIDRIKRVFARPGSHFQAVGIPETFNAKAESLFDKDYMTALYKEGYRLGLEHGRAAR